MAAYPIPDVPYTDVQESAMTTRREMLACIGATPILSSLAPGNAEAEITVGGDYLAWSGHPGPDSSVIFEFGEPYHVVSLKTDGSGIYAPHAFRSSSGAIYLGYYPDPDDWGPEPFPAVLIRSLDEGHTWRSLGQRGNLGYLFGESSDGYVWALDCQGQQASDGSYCTL